MGRSLIFVGLVLVIAGILVGAAGRVPFLSWLGRLPGDIRIEGPHARFYFPITTCLLLSVLFAALIKLSRFIAR